MVATHLRGDERGCQCQHQVEGAVAAAAAEERQEESYETASALAASLGFVAAAGLDAGV